MEATELQHDAALAGIHDIEAGSQPDNRRQAKQQADAAAQEGDRGGRLLQPRQLQAGAVDARAQKLPLPDEQSRVRVLQIHSRKMTVDKDDVNFEELARATEDFNGAQLKAVCVEAGMIALRREAHIIRHEDFVEGIAQVQAKKKASLNYYA